MPAALSEAAILRVIASLVATERAHLGTGRAWEAAGWNAATSFGEAGLALDSLELVAASDVVSRFFRLHETGAENQLLSEETLGGWARTVSIALAGGSTNGFTFATSGTTGLPKLCRQPAATLREECMVWRQIFAPCARIVATVAAHHIYGFLFTVLLPDLTGWPVLDARMMNQGALRNALLPTDLLVGFPTSLTALLRQTPDLPAGLHVVSATSSLPPETHPALQARGAAQVIDIYGSTETAGIAYRNDPALPFTLLPRWQRGSEDGSLLEISSSTPYHLPDRVSWEDERLLRPAERIDGAVQVAGVNVFPEQIASRLRAHSMVADCKVTLDTTLPEPRLRASIVPAPGIEGERAAAACARWAARNLSAPERPVGFGYS